MRRTRVSPLPLLLLTALLAFAGTPALAQWQVDGAPVCTAISLQDNPRIISDGSGGALIVWEDQRGGITSDIYAQHVLSTGVLDPAWPANGLAVCTALSSQLSPCLVGDGAGGAIIAWSDSRPGSHSDIYAQRVLASGTVDPGWPVNGVALCTAAENQGLPRIVGDGAGGAIVTWQDVRAGFPNFDIYAQRVLASGVVDPLWPVNGLATCTAVLDQGSPVLVTDGAGGAIIAWYDNRSNVNYDIYAQRVLNSGTVDPGWPVDGAAICTATSAQLFPAIVASGAGGAIISWQDARSGNYDIYAQRIQSGGLVDPAWPVNGQALCTAADIQRNPQIDSDGAGGAIVTWDDLRGTWREIYLQRVQVTGVVDPAWPVNGRAVGAATNHRLAPQLVTDGAGGAFVTWQDLRSGAGYDVYMHHVLATGVVDPGWTADGEPLCTAVNEQAVPMIASDGAGGAIATWRDSRGSSSDIYASRGTAAGVLAVGPAPVSTPTLAMLAPYPNPSSGRPVAIPVLIATPMRASIEVLDVTGHRVRLIAKQRDFAAGRQILAWDGRNDALEFAPAGVYFIRLRAGSQSITRRTVLLN